MEPNSECHACHKVFNVRPYRLTSVKFCSLRCANKARQKAPAFRCTQCGQEKSPSEFYIDNSRPRGHVARCKVCYGSKQKKSRTNPRRLFVEARLGAKRRGIDWRLTYDEYLDWIFGAPCMYCGDASRPHGIDRINNEPFYATSNVVSACATCNRMKSNQTLHEFLTRIETIAKNLDLVTPQALKGVA